MIRRVLRGHSAYGLIKYLYGPGRRNEHDDVHLIASWDGNPDALEPRFIAELARHDVAGLVSKLEQPVKACDRAPTKWVYHLVLRNDASDRRLSDSEWAKVCTAAMDRTGIAPMDDPAGCRWVAVRHADDHIHVVATLARADGRPPRIWNDYRALAAVASEYEQRFGLRSTTGWDDQTAAARPGVQEQVTAERAGRTVAPRTELRRRVHAAAASSADFAQFTVRLAARGVTVWPRYSERNAGEITGYSVSLDKWTNAAGQPVRFGGGKLAPDLSLPKLRARWSPPAASGAGASERNVRSGYGPPVEEAVWREAERIVRAAADRIRTDAQTQPGMAADTAWAASDVLAVAASAMEGDRPGALSAAADAFDRAGRDIFRRVPAPTDSGVALRAAGRMLAMVGARGAGPVPCTMLIVALTSLVAAVADLRVAQQRLHQAEAARRAQTLLYPAAGGERSGRDAFIGPWTQSRRSGASTENRATDVALRRRQRARQDSARGRTL